MDSRERPMWYICLWIMGNGNCGTHVTYEWACLQPVKHRMMKRVREHDNEMVCYKKQKDMYSTWDEIIRLWVHTRNSQFPSLGSFTCLSIEHRIQGTLWLYFTCNWQVCWDFADEGHLKMLGSPSLDRTQASSAAGEWLNHKTTQLAVVESVVKS